MFKKIRHNLFLFLSIFTNLFIAVVVVLYVDNVADKIQKNEFYEDGLPFSGVLKDPEGNPIDYKVDVRFAIYELESGGEQLYVGQCSGENGIIPNSSGVFQVNLGVDCNMPLLKKTFFSTNKPYYIGVSINQNPELVPRFRLGNISSQNQFLADSKNALISDGVIETDQISLKTTDENIGNIIFYPAIGRNTVIANGNLGLGIFDPKSKITVNDYSDNPSLLINKSHASESTKKTPIIELNYSAENKDDLNFISFNLSEKSGELVSLGEISVLNDSLVYQSAGADFAEYFKTDRIFKEGLVISITENGYRPAEQGDSVIGVVTDSPGFIGNIGERDKTSTLIGLVGQVSVLTATQKTELKMGDPIGVNLKGYVDTGLDNTIGISLENINVLSSNKFNNCPREIINLVQDKNIKCGLIRVLLKL